ncbi:MAG: hypothetical protein CL587_16825 [Alteromonadaceae bacterium]|nr:hypothetical protein [Alteromonadaceae bacterium]
MVVAVMNRIFFYKNSVKRLIVLFCIVGCLFSASALAAPFWEKANIVFNGEPSGMIRDIVHSSDGLWLGAENGLFLLSGKNEKKVEFPFPYSGYISDLYLGQDETLWITVYGEGVYYKRKNEDVKVFNTGKEMETAWKVIQHGESVIILTVGKILLMNIHSKEVTSEIHGLSGEAFTEFPHIFDFLGSVYIFEGANFSIISEGKRDIVSGLVSEKWPGLSKVLDVSKSGGQYFVTGPEGVYTSSLSGENSVFHSINDQFSNVKRVMKLDGELVVVGDRITILKDGGFVEAGWTSLLWDKESVGTLMAADINHHGDLFLATSARGLLYVPAFFNAINTSPKGYEKNIVNLLTDGFSAIAGVTKVYPKHPAKGCLSESTILPVCQNDFKVAIKYSGDFWLTLHNSGASSVIKMLNENGAITDEIHVPYTVQDMSVDTAGLIYLLTSSNQILVQLTRHSWREQKTSLPETENPTCFFLDEEGKAYICSSKNGLLKVDINSGHVKKVKFSTNNGIRYIRAGLKDANNSLWITTNSGLFYSGPDNLWYHLKYPDGIKDFDFEYKGMTTFKDKLLINGDNFDYQISLNEFNERLQERQQKINTAEVTVKNVEDKSPLAPDDKGIYTVTSGNGIFQIRAFVNDYVLRNELFLEYRFSESPIWVKTNSPNFDINFPNLDVGRHNFLIRIHDPRSYVEQPVTTIPLNVLPPWWRTWQAMMVYLVIVIIGLYLAYRSYLKRVDEQGAMLTTLVEEKNSVIQDTNQFMQRMLRNKQRAMANLSHEIRTPLTLILGPLKEVLEAPDSDKTVERIELATRNADRISVLVDQMLELEKLEYIKTLPPQHYELDHDMPRIMFDLKAYAALKKHQLTWQCSGQKRITLFTDSLEKILSNLVSNAVKYTPEGGKIGVSVKQRQLQLVIEVSDNGAGMTEEQVDKIFDRYTRLENEAEGTGVGLALVKELVIANCGHIKVESEPGAGSCFTVFLPMTGSTTKSQAMAKEVKENPARHYNIDRELAGEGKFILVVDDNEELRTYIRDLLGGVYRCLMASNGKEALDIVARAKPDLVLTDYKMPDMDGLAFAKALRRDDSLAKVPLIFMSAFGDPKSIRLALEAGADSYMTKPVEKPLLLSRISNLFERYQPVEPEVTEHVTEEPEDELPEFENEQGQRFYFKALELMEKHYGDEDFTKPVFAEMMAVSDRHLQRLFQSSFDKPFNAVIREFRLEKARGMLEEGMQITQISYDTGFASPSHFSRAFKDVYHTTPSKYQKEHYHFKRKA